MKKYLPPPYVFAMAICCLAFLAPIVISDPPPAPKPVSAFLSGQVRHRIAADRFLRRLEREGNLTAEQAVAVHTIRNNPEVMNDFVAGLPAVKGVSGAMADGGHPLLDWLTSVGKALWDNRQAILEFIMQLVKLFQ